MLRVLLGLSVLSLTACRQDGTASTEKGLDPDSGSVSSADEDSDGFAPSDGDCDDGNPLVHPGAVEVCDGLDNNCDGTVDEGLTSAWYQDADGDGYGDPATATTTCTAEGGYVQDGTDCVDTDPGIHPNADESCTDTYDKNCDGSFGYADLDADSVPACEDCNDLNAAVNPNAAEICDANNVDENCNGLADDADDTLDTSTTSTWYTDTDGDGFGDTASAKASCDGPGVATDGDCNDADAAFYPGAPETDCSDPNDYNCDGSVGYTDNDLDGFAACEECDDSNVAVNPDAIEACNGYDDNCDGAIDEGGANAGTWYYDGDGDVYGDASQSVVACDAPTGYVADGSDCVDSDPTIHPGATEVCTDAVDKNCDGSVGYRDADGDGYAACEECNDADAAVNPGAKEICDPNNTDEDCNGLADDADPSVDVSTWNTTYSDTDGDGYGVTGTGVTGCDGVGAPYDGDCLDTDPAYHPNAPETDCTDPNDYNCDGAVGYADNDGDGFAACQECDDTNAAISPAATEVCNGVDDNCDGNVDEGGAGASTWYIDVDGDGYGDGTTAIVACSAPFGYIADGSDCNDADSLIHPGAPETCTDSVDLNCDGSVGYVDADGDGVAACQDCNDADAAVNPYAIEICDPNNTDEDCDGYADDLDPSVDPGTQVAVYTDTDGDGYGVDGTLTVSCDGVGAPYGGDCNDADALYHPNASEVCTDKNDYNCDGSIGYADADGDGFAACLECDDSNAAINPNAIETCNQLDDDCNGLVDDNATNSSTWYDDADRDGFGDDSTATLACDAPVGAVSIGGDCDDSDLSTYPGAAEFCDGIDNDCNGIIDDGALNPTTWYGDADGDGYGDASSPIYACSQPANSSIDGTDCDDNDANVNPGAAEYCNGVDDDCNAVIDDNAVDATTWYLDGDGDNYGAGTTMTSCSQPSGYAAADGDCNDLDTRYNPGALEVDCTDPNDYNCDGVTGYADVDADGWAACEECDDLDAAVFPGATEVCDGIDNDCDGNIDLNAVDEVAWYADADGDRYGDAGTVTYACTQPSGYLADSTDCDDSQSSIHPGAAEYCDGVDQDCDGVIDDNPVDPTIWYQDADGDGYGVSSATISACTMPAGYAAVAGDCNDADTRFNPGAVEADCTDPNDYNCDGTTGYVDADGDSWAACVECDDNDASNYPGAIERCDNADNDCDGLIDEAGATGELTWYADADGDTYGDATNTVRACSQPSGYLADNTDCDDSRADTNPGATEFCNGIDDNCNSVVDDNAADTVTWYRDADGDNYGLDGTTVTSCTKPAGYAAVGGDCNDASTRYNPGAPETDCTDPNDYNCDGLTGYVDADHDGYAACSECDDGNAAVNPGATEACNGYDDDCDGAVDESGATGSSTWYKDADSDSYGNASSSVLACNKPVGYVSDNTDCNDGNATAFPGASEVCDGVDNNCNGLVDDNASNATVWYADTDGDAYGNPTSSTTSCSKPAGYVANSTDCNDSVAAINPGASEVCNGIDDNCDGIRDTDAIDRSTWYKDADGDAYGTSGSTTLSCTQPAGYVANSTDCNDGNSAINPGATEACNSVDDDCDGLIDEAGATGSTTWYKDVDGDNYGGTTTQTACTQPSGYVATGGDCNDAASAINPGATEKCNSVDDDCDGAIDEAGATGGSTWYADTDGDKFGNASSSTTACSQPTGYVANSTDCNDSNSAINPLATEICDSVDNDCDGLIDEAGASGETTWYQDADGDLYGNASVTKKACSKPAGYVANSTDCNDALSTINPAATEICDSLDNDCDGSTDEAGAVGEKTWYKDADGDGYGVTSPTKLACSQPTGYSAYSTDCDDTTALKYPGKTDICDGLDNDCNGYIDDGTGANACGCNVHYYGTHAYLFCTSAKSWTDGQAWCQARGYNMLTVNDVNENKWAVDKAYTWYYGKWWTGGNDRAKEGTWTWESGATWSYSNWHTGEPNDAGGNEDCMQFGRFLDYTWNDEPCTSAFYFACESK